MLRHQDLRDSLIDDTGFETPAPDALAGPFGHVIVDEAQELTDAEWQMLLRRCPSRSLTIVGDRAQARRGFDGSWASRLERVGIHDPRIAPLTVNYRTPEEVMAEAAPVILAELPDANVPTSIRSSGLPVLFSAVANLDALLADWLDKHADGVACVISADPQPDRPRVRSLTPQLAKGLEFDLVVLLDSARWSAVDRYVAMTRATQQLVLLD
jgi:DNA helicase IV